MKLFMPGSAHCSGRSMSMRTPSMSSSPITPPLRCHPMPAVQQDIQELPHNQVISGPSPPGLYRSNSHLNSFPLIPSDFQTFQRPHGILAPPARIILQAASRCVQVLPGASRCLQLLPGASRCFWVLPGAFKHF